MPIVLIVICLILSVTLKNRQWRRRFFWLGLGMLLFFSNAFISNEVMRAWEVDPIPLMSITKTYEVGIVLGGIIQGDTELTDRAFFSKGADRIYHASMLYKRGIIKKVFVSGGTGRLIDIGQREGLEMVKALVEMGVKRDDIDFEIVSRNTYENAVEVKKALTKKGILSKECLLITSAFHMRRSEACFRSIDYPANVFSVDIYTHNRRFTPDVLIVPSVNSLVIWHLLVKEWIGYGAYFVMGYV